MNKVKSEHFFVRDTIHGQVVIINSFTEHEIYVREDKIDDLILALQEFKDKKKIG